MFEAQIDNHAEDITRLGGIVMQPESEGLEYKKGWMGIDDGKQGQLGERALVNCNLAGERMLGVDCLDPVVQQ